MKSLCHVIYASRAAPGFAEHEIPGLLKQARLSNAKRQLTGMLVYVGGLFVQVIEGEPGMVQAVYASILRDKRHGEVTCIVSEPIAQRSFEGWTMEHSTIDPHDAGQLTGVSDFFSAPLCVARIDVKCAKKLLWSLNMRRWEVGRSAAGRQLGRVG